MASGKHTASDGKAGAGTIVAATAARLERMAARNPELKCFTAITRETALAEAALADARAASGDKRPLNGLNIAVKDIIDVAGVVSGCGSLTRAKAAPAPLDAPVVERLRAAGAVVVGKTHTVEYAFGGWGTNETVGTPVNPWDLAVHRAPGGSSSGSGVSVGAGLLPMALGTDTGGSVRIPAALCGCVGLKTSVGRVSRARVAPLSGTLDSIGPLACDVTTAARAFAVMQGHDPLDATTDGVAPVDPFADLEAGIAGFRIGRFADADLTLATDEVKADYAAAVARLEKLGARIEPVKLPRSFSDYGLLTGQIIGPEAYALYQHFADDEASGLAAPIRARMLSGKGTTYAEYAAVTAARAAAIAEVPRIFGRLDAVVLPTIPFPAVPLGEVDERRAPMAHYTRWVNYLNLAALAIPTALSKAGLPLSLQIVVRRFDDALALRIGRAFEVARGAFPTSPKSRIDR